MRGTLNNFEFEANINHSTLFTQFVDECYTDNKGWLLYQTSNEIVRQVEWNYLEDTWHIEINFIDMESQFEFVTSVKSNIVWRIFMMNTKSRVVQYNCSKCCTDTFWTQDVIIPAHQFPLPQRLFVVIEFDPPLIGPSYDFPTNDFSTNDIDAINDESRRLRYQSSDGMIHTLNNSGDSGRETLETNPLKIEKAMLDTKMAIADDAIYDPPVIAFYQTNGSNITATSWKMTDTLERTTEQLLLSP